MLEEKYKGLTKEEVSKKKSLGLSNEVIDTYTPSYPAIFIRNIFNLINLILIPLMTTLWIFGLKTEVLAFSTFAIINTITSILDEVRAKKHLDKLKSEFQQTANVLRDGSMIEVPLNEVVQEDIIFAKEGEGIVADGQILESNYLQLDESALTGESNYVQRERGEVVKSGSFVVTGNCVYRAENIGKNNYLNTLGKEALKYSEKRSSIQVDGDKLILALIISCIVLGVLNFAFAAQEISTQQKLLSLTTIVVLIIPQTLIFLFTLTFTISITKLFNKGVLIQKGGSIEELSKIDVVCFDKTGTITTNNMFLKDVKYWNTSESEVGTIYNSVKDEIVSVNKTQSILHKLYSNSPIVEVSDFDQEPFTSKHKSSMVTGKVKGSAFTLQFGAFTILEEKIDSSVREEVRQASEKAEQEGNRVLLGLYFTNNTTYSSSSSSNSSSSEDFSGNTTSKVAIYIIEEELNLGIKDIFNQLKEQQIGIKIISGDSLVSVQRILGKLGIDDSKAVDLSTINESDFDQVVLNNNIFTRSKPEDKLRIIKRLKDQGVKVAMVGDGINDVLAIKAADVSIAMENGSKIAREVADIVLLKNDYSKIPEIFFEGENIVYNLKLSTKLFLIKSFFTILLAIFFTIRRESIPLNPASVLIFSFLGTSAPSYVIVFTRQLVKNKVPFFKDIIWGTLPDSLVFAFAFLTFYLLNKDFYNFTQVGTGLVIIMLSLSIIYSLILIWESKKLRNLAASIFIFVLIMAVGSFQTILPMTQYSQDRQLLGLGVIFIGSFIVFRFFSGVFKKKNLKFTILKLILSFVWIPIVWFFPFQSYYQVTNLPQEFLPQIAIYSIVGLISLFIISKVFHAKN